MTLREDDVLVLGVGVVVPWEFPYPLVGACAFATLTCFLLLLLLLLLLPLCAFAPTVSFVLVVVVFVDIVFFEWELRCFFKFPLDVAGLALCVGLPPLLVWLFALVAVLIFVVVGAVVTVWPRACRASVMSATTCAGTVLVIIRTTTKYTGYKTHLPGVYVSECGWESVCVCFFFCSFGSSFWVQKMF